MIALTPTNMPFFIQYRAYELTRPPELVGDLTVITVIVATVLIVCILTIYGIANLWEKEALSIFIDRCKNPNK